MSLIDEIHQFDAEYNNMIEKRRDIEFKLTAYREMIEERIFAIDDEIVYNFPAYLIARADLINAAGLDFIQIMNSTDPRLKEKKDMGFHKYIKSFLYNFERPDRVAELEAEMRELIKVWDAGVGTRCLYCGHVVKYGTKHLTKDGQIYDGMLFCPQSSNCRVELEYDKKDISSAFYFKYDIT